MPLVVRYIEPRHEKHRSSKMVLSRDGTETGARQREAEQLPPEYQEMDKVLTTTSCMPILESVSTNHLQALMVHRLSSVIRQLSSLAQHAESVIGEIVDGLASCYTRSLQLEARTRRLTQEVLPSLDPEIEATEGFEIPHPDFQFKSRREANQMVLNKHPPPPPLALTIQSAHTPALHLISDLWPDQRNALHIYSNPSYFFEQWMASVKRGALRRKSSGRILSPTGNGALGGRLDSIGKVTPIGGAKKLKRSVTVSSRRKPRPLSYHSSSNMSLDTLGLPSSSRQKGFQRTYSMRVSPTYAAGTRRSIRIPKPKHIADPLSKTIAAMFDMTSDYSPELDKDAVKPEKAAASLDSPKFQRGGLRRSLSLRRSRSRSKSPATPSNIEGSTKSSFSDALPKKQTEIPGFGTTFSVENGPKVTSTFKSTSTVPNRPVASLLTRINTPPAIRVRTFSDARELGNKTPVPSRSMTVSASGNANLRNVAARVREKLKTQERPSSVIDLPLSEKESLGIVKNVSQSSLRTNSALGRPHSMLVMDLESPLPEEMVSKETNSPQSRKPRRRAPPRPPTPDGGGRGTPDSLKQAQTTPTLDSPILMSLDARKIESDCSSPIPMISPSTDSSSPPPASINLNSQVKANSNSTEPIMSPNSDSNSPGPSSSYKQSTDKTTPDSRLEKGAIEEANDGSNQSSGKVDEVRSGPPPPPQRMDSLSNTQNPKKAQEALTGSGPATPGTAHTAHTQNSLDTERRQSVAKALSEVLTNINRRSNPLSPTSPLSANGDLKTFDMLNKSTTANKIVSPKTPLGQELDMNATLTPFDHSPQFKMSPISSFNTPSSVRQPGTFGSSPRIPPSKRRFFKKGSSLYISPHKITCPTGSMGFSERAEEILRAGGVENGRLENSRSDLLAAIRKGIQLKKVEEEAARKNEEVSWDVAAILERYEVLHSESEGESDVDDEWLDD